MHFSIMVEVLDVDKINLSENKLNGAKIPNLNYDTYPRLPLVAAYQHFCNH